MAAWALDNQRRFWNLREAMTLSVITLADTIQIVYAPRSGGEIVMSSITIEDTSTENIAFVADVAQQAIHNHLRGCEVLDAVAILLRSVEEVKGNGR